MTSWSNRRGEKGGGARGLWIAAVVAILLLAAGLLAASRLGSEPEVELTPEEIAKILEHAPLGPAPESPTNRVADDPAARQLGKRLFFEPRFSADGRISCATCHDSEKGWANGALHGRGLGETERHVPSLWNVAHNRWYFWDGRADTLWMQALQPIEHPDEFGGDRLRCAHVLAADPELAAAYEAVFGPLPDVSDPERFPPHARPVPESPDDPSNRAWVSMSEADRDAVNRVFSNLGKAIEAFERSIRSEESPFDVFAQGLADGDETKLAALSVSARRGLKLFVGKANCILCHSGPHFSDGEFHDLRLPEDRSVAVDTGRFDGVRRLLDDPFNSLGPYSDDPTWRKTKYLVVRPNAWGQFKTPSLRNVAQTAPYMHTGVFSSLEEVLHFYSTMENAAPRGHHDEGVLAPLRLTEQEQRDLIAFLESLTGGTPRELSGQSAGG